MANPVSLHFPKKLVFGDQCFGDFINYFLSLSFDKVYIVADPNVTRPLETLVCALEMEGLDVFINRSISAEPTLNEYMDLLKEAEQRSIDSVIGLGGGSILDVAKLLALMYKSGQSVDKIINSGPIGSRKLFLACLPTTAGTGSEVSPNAILLDEKEELKKGIVHPFLVPDVTYVDPVLTHTVPPEVTAATGIDALTHCIEAYANKYANPVVDMYALEGIRLIYNNLEAAYQDGSDAEARMKVALGSMYGGICLGPVNTAAVHAMAYPLGSKYHIPHGISNALLLGHVLEFNLPEGADRYAYIASALGVKNGLNELERASEGIKRIKGLCENLGIPGNLNDFNISVQDVPALAKSAMNVQRLLKNNLRKVTQSEAEKIFYKLF